MEIPAAGWVTISSVATLVVTQIFAIRKEKVLHKQQLKKEVFLRKLQAYESNITYASEGMNTFRSLFDNIKRASDSQSYDNMVEIKKNFDNISKNVIPFLHTIQLYSKINTTNLKPLEAEFKRAINKLYDFKDDIKNLGPEKAKKNLDDTMEKIESIFLQVENSYQLVFKEMQTEIAAYL